MATPNPTIFRTEALEYRLRNQGQRQSVVTFPRFMANRVMIVLWILVGLLGASGVAAGMPTVPVSTGGMAFVTDDTWANGDAPVVAVILASDINGILEPGSSASVQLGAGGRAIDGTVASIERGAYTPAQIAERLGLPESSLSMLPGSMILAWVTFEGTTRDDFGIANAGRADLDIGTRRAGTFLPLVGRFFEE